MPLVDSEKQAPVTGKKKPSTVFNFYFKENNSRSTFHL